MSKKIDETKRINKFKYEVAQEMGLNHQNKHKMQKSKKTKSK